MCWFLGGPIHSVRYIDGRAGEGTSNLQSATNVRIILLVVFMPFMIALNVLEKKSLWHENRKKYLRPAKIK